MGVRRDPFRNEHPYDAAILKLGYGAYHHLDGVHRSRKRKTTAPYSKPGRVRVLPAAPQHARATGEPRGLCARGAAARARQIIECLWDMGAPQFIDIILDLINLQRNLFLRYK